MHCVLERRHVEFEQQVIAYLEALQADPDLDLEAVRAEYLADPKTLASRGQDFIRRLGRDGWLGVSVPQHLGGMGRGFIEQWLLLEALKYRCLPTGQLLIQSIIPALVMLASEAMQARYLPLCLGGQVMFAIGYSEPQAGTDLAALRTRAERVDDGYLINGQKTWTTNAHMATHLWLAARTGPSDSRHRGISLFIVPLDSLGISISPILTQAGERTNQVFFDNVFVPESQRVGDENDGWTLIMAQLNFERIFCVSEMLEEWHRFLAWWGENRHREAGEVAYHTRQLARVAADIEVCRLMAMRAAWMMDQGRVPEAEASISKIFYSETHQRMTIAALGIMGHAGRVRFGEPDAPADGRVERAYRGTPVYKFGAGTNEVQRDIIANRGLGLPRIR